MAADSNAPLSTPKNATMRNYQNPLLVGVITLLVGVSIAIVQYKVPTIMEPIMQQFSMSGADASWLMSIFTLIGVFIALPSGGLANRFGPKNMMIASTLVIITGSLIGTFARMSWLLIASRAIEGIALTVITTNGPILVQRCVKPEKIGMAMGIWGIWGCIGSTIAGVITPTIFEQIGFKGVWLGYAAFTLVAALLLLFIIRVPKTVPVEQHDARQGGQAQATGRATTAQGETASQVSGGRLRYRDMINPSLILFFIGFATFQLCLLAVLAFVPTILQKQDFDPTLSGFISTLPMLLSIIASPLFGIISDKIGRAKPLLLLAYIVMGPCTFLMYTQTGPLLWVAVFVMGFVGMGCIGVSLSAFVNLLPSPHYVSLGMGVLVLVQSLGQFLGTYVVQGLLGAQLDNWFFTGAISMILGIAGTLFTGLAKFK
jgi:MFS family permease